MSVEVLATTSPGGSSPANPNDPMGVGYDTNVFEFPQLPAALTVVVNAATYTSVLAGGYPMSKIEVFVNVSSGNIDVGAYLGTGTGPTRIPGARVASSGSVPVPSQGRADIAIGATVTPSKGDYFGAAVDNAVTSLGTAFSMSANVLAAAWAPRCYQEVAAFPLPATATPATTGLTSAAGIIRAPHMIGVA